MILSMHQYLFRLRTNLQKKLDDNSVVLDGRLWNALDIQSRLVAYKDQVRGVVPTSQE
ncbi:hypothetical protein F5Y05DRAFT_392551 [Hypoxylon sp. FL0543]|nr:hypothetical protein F5Y05DRAFT_392551 [Hypoxylon sp. FL0543]